MNPNIAELVRLLAEIAVDDYLKEELHNGDVNLTNYKKKTIHNNTEKGSKNYGAHQK